MNKHTKTAFLIAPILAVIGYIAADYYQESDAKDEKIVELKTVDICDVINQQCVLKSGDFEVNVFDKNNQTTVNSTFPLDSATLFLVDQNNKATTYPLGMIENPYYWHSETDLRELAGRSGQRYKLRLVINIKGGKYISEFETQTK
jgi:hypothetical protein